MYLRKAFDCVNHGILLRKLVCYGIIGDSPVWFASYLSHRQQKVCTQDQSSAWGEVCVRMSQGSILGPLCR